MSDKPNWEQIEKSGKDYYIDYLDQVSAQAKIKTYKENTYKFLDVKAGDKILDVGCGNGDDAVNLSKYVGNGQVYGMDKSVSLVQEAKQRLEGNLELPVTFIHGDVTQIPFADGFFSGCRSDRLFMHLRDRKNALAEIYRVLAPGGKLVMYEPDWGTLLIDHDDFGLTRRIIQNHFDRNIINPWSGRQISRLIAETGFENIVVVDTTTLVLHDFHRANQFFGLEDACKSHMQEYPDESAMAELWLKQLKTAHENGVFFCSVTGFTVVSRKPMA